MSPVLTNFCRGWRLSKRALRTLGFYLSVSKQIHSCRLEAWY